MKKPSIITLLACLAAAATLSIGTADAQTRHGSYDHAPHDHSSRFQQQHPPQIYQPRHVPSQRGSSRGGSCQAHGGSTIRLVAGHQCGKPTRPCGWHSIEWFLRRGYNLDNYSYVFRDGTVRHGRNARR